jgi:hypothetical protein
VNRAHFVAAGVSIRALFKLARRLSPCILYLDQIEVLGGKREWAETGTTGVNERVLSTLLNEMDGVESSGQVIVVAVRVFGVRIVFNCLLKYLLNRLQTNHGKLMMRSFAQADSTPIFVWLFPGQKTARIFYAYS